MATATRTPAIPTTGDGLIPYRLTIRQFEKMIGGIIPEDARVELLDGRLAEKMTKNTPHNYTIGMLAELIRILVAGRLVVNEEKSVQFRRTWRPEPDIAVAIGPRGRYRKVDPGAKDLRLIVEVADSSYPTDRGIKWVGYAAAGVPAYWIVDLAGRKVEVFADPVGRGKSARYRESKTHAEGDSVPLVIEGRELGAIAVKDFLP